MKKQHSPSPWTMAEHSWSDASIFDSNGETVCSLSIYHEATAENQQELESQMGVNARLIAAAPELLAILKTIVDAGGIVPELIFDDARAVIAKAESANP